MTEQPADKDQLRSVVCEIHGLRYDPQTRIGCARCRQDSLSGSTDGAPSRSGPPLVVWILVTGAALLAAIFMFGGDDPIASDASVDSPDLGRSTTSTPRQTTNARGATAPATDNFETEDASFPPARADDGWPTYEARGSITISDEPEDEPFLLGDYAAPDIDSVRFRAIADELVITFEFTRTLDSHAFEIATALGPGTVFVDTDLDPSTGEKGFAGRVGFERAIHSYVGVKYDADAESFMWVNGLPETPIVEFVCSHDIGTVNGFFLDATFEPDQEEALENTSCFGTTLEVRVPYERLGVSAGQTVRLATEENMGSGKVPQYFLADVLLTLD